MTSGSLGVGGTVRCFPLQGEQQGDLATTSSEVFVVVGQASSNTVGDLLVSNLDTRQAREPGEQFCSSPTVGLDNAHQRST